jgi:uncharacterized phage protein (TIGR02218 family)
VRTVSTTLHNYFAAGRISWTADLWRIQLVSGTTLYWTSHDQQLVWNTNTYAVGPGLMRSRLSWRIGIDGSEDSDQVKLRIMPRSVDMLGSVPLAQALRQGDFDGATVSLSKAYGGTPGTIVDVSANRFVGRVGQVEVEDFAFIVSVLAPTAELDQPYPRNVLQPQCGNRLYDETCGVNAGSYQSIDQVTGSVNAARTQFATGLVQAAGYFSLGRFRWTTGANAGRSQYVRNHAAGGVLTFPAPWPNAVAVGDTFAILAGCDKRQTTCASKFSNIIHFRGAPFVPAAETTT